MCIASIINPRQILPLAPMAALRPILWKNYFLPGDIEQQIQAFVEDYKHQRYHEGLNNVTPADAYFGRVQAIIQQRERIKRQTIEYRRLQHRKLAA